jgi:hypothetical protein
MRSEAPVAELIEKYDPALKRHQATSARWQKTTST